MSPMAAAQVNASRPIDAAFEAEIRSRIGAITGCHVTEVRRMTATENIGKGQNGQYDMAELQKSAKRERIVLFLEGWSPSLHQIDHEWTYESPRGDPLQTARDMLTSLSSRIALQRSRAKAGVSMGTAMPLETGTSTMKVDHLSMDEGLISILLENGWGLTDVRNAVTKVHRSSVRLDDPQELTDYTNSLHGRTMMPSVYITDKMAFDGRKITIWTETKIPETAAAAAQGRRVGDLVDVPNAIADRIIETVDLMPEVDSMTILITPKNVPISGVDRWFGED